MLDRRPELDALMGQLRPGDTLVVWRLDRLGCSLRHLIDTVTALDERQVGFQSLRENVDTTTPGGRLVFHLSPRWHSSSGRLSVIGRSPGWRRPGPADGPGGGPAKRNLDQVKTARRLYDERELTVGGDRPDLRREPHLIYIGRSAGTGRSRPQPAAAAAKARRAGEGLE